MAHRNRSRQKDVMKNKQEDEEDKPDSDRDGGKQVNERETEMNNAGRKERRRT